MNVILNYCRLLLNHGNGDYYDFQNFFDLFLETQVCNLRECLLEWLFRSRVSLSSSKTVANTLTADLKLPGIPGIPFNETVENWVNVELTSLVDNVNVSATFPLDETVPDPVVYTDADSIIDLITLLPGENILSLDKMRWCVQATKTTDTVPQPCPGCLVITTYRVILLSPRKLGARSIALHKNPTSNPHKTNNDQTGNRVKMKNNEAEHKTLGQHSRYGVSRYFSMTSVPLSAIFRANVAQTRNTFFIVSKDFRVIRIILSCAIASNHCPAVSGNGRNINDGACASADNGGVTPSTTPSNSASLSSSPSHPPSLLPSQSSSSSASATISHSNGVTNNITVSGLSSNNKNNLNVDDKKNDTHDRNSVNEMLNHENNNKMALDTNNTTATHANQSAHGYGQGQGHGQGQREGNNSKIVDHSSYSTSKTTADIHNSTSNRNHNNNNNNNTNNNHNHNHNHNTNHNKSSNHSINNSSSTNLSHQRNNDVTNNNSNHISSSSSRAENLIITLHRLAFYLSSKIALKPFAYHYRKRFEHDGWQYCDLMGEYRRQGLLNHPEWKVHIYI